VTIYSSGTQSTRHTFASKSRKTSNATECSTCEFITIKKPKPNPTTTQSICLTGQFADKPTRGQSSRELDNPQASQLTDSEV